jgi:hypothetical protein
MGIIIAQHVVWQSRKKKDEDEKYGGWRSTF